MGIGSANPLLLATAASGGETGEGSGGSPVSDPVTRSLRLDGSAYLLRSTGSTSTTWTLSFWVRRATISGPSQHQYLATWGISGSAGEGLSFRGTGDSSNTDKLMLWNGSTSTYSSGVYRDPAAWANVCISVNSGTATVYYNGESVISGVSGIQAWGSMRLGAWLNQNELEGYMADVYGVEGAALDHTSFTTSNDYGGIKPKAYTGSFGTNGFHIDAQPSHDADLLVSSIDRNDGDTTFADAAQGHGLVRYGSTHHDDTVGNPFDSSGTAIHFDGSGDYIKVWDGSSGDYQLGANDYTIECWFNLSSQSSSNYNTIFQGYNNINGHLFERGGVLYYYTGAASSSYVYDTSITDVDVNTWHHVAVVRNGNTISIYLDGSLNSSKTRTGGWTEPNSTSSQPFRIGGGDHYYWDGYIYDFRVTGGEAKYSGSTYTVPSAPFELNPVYIGGDQSGNKNHFTPTNISGHDVVLDTPTKNYATLNPLERTGTRDSVSEGNLKTTHLTTSGYGYISSTMGLPSGKWIWAVRMNSQGGGIPTVGFHKTYGKNFTSGSVISLGPSSTDSWAVLYTQSGYQTTLYNGSSNTTSMDIGNFTNGDRMVVAVDIDAGKAWWGKFDGTTLTWHNSGNPANGTNATATFTAGTAMTPAVSCYNNYGSVTCNFGQDATYAGEESPSTTYADSDGNGSFDFQPPSGFLAVCSDNLDAPTVTPSEHFDILTYNGNSDLYNASGSTQNVTGVNFDVGMAWIKDRDNNSSGYTNSGSDEYGHYLFDTVTGTSSGGYNLDGDVVSSGSGTTLNSGYYGVTSFSAGSGTSRGITVDEAGETNFDYDDGYYTLTERYVAWLWKLGSTGSSSTWNSSYTAPSTEHYNASAGVTAIEVSPASSGNLEVAHSLSAAPEFFFVGTDSYADFSGYPAFHKDLDSGKYLQLDGNSAQSSDSTYFPSGAAHADYIKLGSVFADTYSYGGNLRIWAFTGVEGYSKFGTYKGAGSNGVFVYTGHRPKMVWIKNMDTTGNWFIFDAARDTYNETVNYLHANSSTSETTNSGYKIDVLSNGFKINVESTHMNNSAYDYVFCSFSESPFKHANAI